MVGCKEVPGKGARSAEVPGNGPGSEEMSAGSEDVTSSTASGSATEMRRGGAPADVTDVVVTDVAVMGVGVAVEEECVVGVAVAVAVELEEMDVAV